MTNKTLRDYINLVENAQRESVAEGYTPSAGELARDLTKMPDSDFNKKYGMSKQQANHYYSSSKLKEQGVAEGYGLRGTGNPGMPTPYDQGQADAKKGRPYDNPYDQPGEEQEHRNYRKGYEQGKQQGVAEGFSDIVKGVKRKVAGKADPKEVEKDYAVKARREIGDANRYNNPAAYADSDKAVKRYNKVAKVVNKEGVAEAEKKPHPKTWHDVDPKLGKAVDKMSQAEKVKKGLAHPDTLKKKGVAEDQLEETSPDAIEKIEQLVRK